MTSAELTTEEIDWYCPSCGSTDIVEDGEPIFGTTPDGRDDPEQYLGYYNWCECRHCGRQWTWGQICPKRIDDPGDDASGVVWWRLYFVVAIGILSVCLIKWFWLDGK